MTSIIPKAVLHGPLKALKNLENLNICLLGPPGSGKGTYGKLISSELNLPIVTTSDVLKRDPVLKETYVDKGIFVPPKVAADATLSAMKGPGYVLDGFPRSRGQLVTARETWPIELRPNLMISIDVPDWVVVSKLEGRRKCGECGADVNISDVDSDGWCMPPRIPSPCSWEHEPFWGRRPDDEDADIVRRRLEDFRKETEPVKEDFGKVVSFAPYRGVQDVPELIDFLRKCLQQS